MFIVILQLDSFIHFDEFNINTWNTTERDSDNYACGTTTILCNVHVHTSVENSLTYLYHLFWCFAKDAFNSNNPSQWPFLSQLCECDCVGPCICMWVLAISLITITTTVHNQYKLYRTYLKHHLWRTASDILPSNIRQCHTCPSHIYISALPFPRSSHLSNICTSRSKNAMTVDTG